MSLTLVTFSHGVTVNDLVDRTTSMLYGLDRTELNQLNGAITDTATTLTFADSLNGIRPGAYVEVDDEDMYVRSTSGATAVVRRGMNGTTAASHDDVSLVRVEPRFSRSRIVQALRADITSWPSSVYARYLGTLDVGSNVRGVDVDGLAGVDGAQLLAAQRAPVGGLDTPWPTVPGARMVRRQATANFASGYALEFPNFGGNQGGRWWGWDDWAGIVDTSTFSVQLRVKAPYNTAVFSSGTDVGTVLGMPLAVAEIAPYGAAARLMSTRDIARTDTSALGRARIADEVHVGDQTSTANALWARRDYLLAEAAKSLFLSEDGMPSYS